MPPEPLSRGLPPPDPRSLFPLSSTEFVEPSPHPEQNSWVRHWYTDHVRKGDLTSYIFRYKFGLYM